MLQAILIGLIVFIGKADYFIGTAMFGRPLVLGALVGIVLGDIPTGVMIGFQLELIFMGMQAIGASIPPDMIVGSVLGTAFAITTGKVWRPQLRSLCRRQSCQRLLSICSMASLRRSWQRRRTALPRKVSI